jgi:hypothetical protein
MKMPTGNTVELLIPEPFAIDSIRQVISQKEGIPLHYLQLKFQGRLLEDGHTLDEYGVEYESTLDLVVRKGSKSAAMCV